MAPTVPLSSSSGQPRPDQSHMGQVAVGQHQGAGWSAAGPRESGGRAQLTQAPRKRASLGRRLFAP